MMNDFEKEVVITALKKMFNGGYFDICTVDKCLKLTGAIPDHQDYTALSALHCVYWSEMSQDLRNTVFEKTMVMISNPGFDLTILDMNLSNSNTLIKTDNKPGLLSKFTSAIRGS